MESARQAGERRERAALAIARGSAAALRRTARRFSLCADDADDAYQRALLILLTKAPDRPPDQLVAWMQVVTRREALRVRRERARLLDRAGPGPDEPDPIAELPSAAPGPAERVERRERVAIGAAALAALKPQERRALALKASGYSYAEIMELTGWTYTKVNRCMAEGRKAFLERFAAIYGGNA
jgi:RNA polymerase sigma factor (sigma-70 family)